MAAAYTPLKPFLNSFLAEGPHSATAMAGTEPNLAHR